MTTSIERPPESAAELTEPELQYDRPRFTLAGAVRRHWFLTLLPVVVLAAAGIVAGRAKPPTYSATATINVGKSDINTQATPGYLVAAEALASSYSRLVESQHVAIPAAQKVGETPAEAGSQVTAVPIPNEPTFTITAEGSSAARATALANAAVAALQAYVTRSATQDGGTAQLLAQYQKAQALTFQLQQKVKTLEARAAPIIGTGTSTTPTTLATTTSTTPAPGVSQAQITAAKVAEQTAALQAQSLSNQYLSLSENGVAPTLDVLIAPTGSTSTNRTTNMEKYGIVGAVGGLVIGVAFAALAGAVDTRRRRPV